MIRRLIILLLIVGCEETGITSNGLTDGTAVQDTIIINQDTTIIEIVLDTTIIVLDTIIINQDTTIIELDTIIIESEYPPSVVITYPPDFTDEDYGHLDSFTTIKADAIDDSGISNVQFLINGELVFTDSIAPYEYEWDVCAEANDEVSVLAKAEDIDGNLSQSELAVYYITANYDCIGDCGGNTLVKRIDDSQTNPVFSESSILLTNVFPPQSPMQS
jgi:hypothetical protein